MILTPAQQNQRLARANLITGIGDWLSYFGSVAVTYSETQSAALAAMIVPVKSAGVAIGAASTPWILNKLGHRSTLILTQALSGVSIAAAALALATSLQQSWIVLLCASLLTSILKQYFDTAREAISKNLGDSANQRTLQAEILYGQYLAQMGGPLLALAMIKLVPIFWLLTLDAISFIFTAHYLRNIKDLHTTLSTNILRAWEALKSSPALRLNFSIRTIGYWTTTAVANVALFSIVKERFGAHPLNTAVVYSLIGLGSVFATRILIGTRGLIQARATRMLDTQIAGIGMAILALTRPLLVLVANKVGFGLVVVSGGVANGLNATGSQALRRKLSSTESFPAIVSAETIVARSWDALIGFVVAIGLSSGVLSIYSCAFIACAVALLIGVIQFRARSLML